MKLNRSLIIHSTGVGIILFGFVFLVSVNIIGFSVKEKCRLAQNKYDGDCVQALISYLDDETNNFAGRNDAVWALGQLGDERAMPILEKYYSDYNGNREKRDQALSQFELKRAMSYMQGNPNITTFFWHFGEGID